MYAPWFYCVFDGAIQCNHINISRYLYCISHNTIKFGLGWVESKNMDPCPSLACMHNHWFTSWRGREVCRWKEQEITYVLGSQTQIDVPDPSQVQPQCCRGSAMYTNTTVKLAFS